VFIDRNIVWTPGKCWRCLL